MPAKVACNRLRPAGVHGRELEFVNGGDEHGILRARRGAAGAGRDGVAGSPAIAGPTVNLHEHYIVVRGGLEAGRVEAVWPIDARGCIR